MVTINKAIETLTNHRREDVPLRKVETIEALNLGIEALKRITITREIHTAYWAPQLPGEKEE